MEDWIFVGSCRSWKKFRSSLRWRDPKSPPQAPLAVERHHRWNLHSKGWPVLIFPKSRWISSHWWILWRSQTIAKNTSKPPQIRRVQWFLGLFDLCMFFVLLQLYSYHVVGPYFHHYADPLDFVIELHNILILIIPILTTARCLTQRMLHLARSLRQSVDMRDGFDKFYGPELRWFFQFPVSQADHSSRIVPLELLMK